MTTASIFMSPEQARGQVTYNTACAFCSMDNKKDALIAIKKAWESGYRDSNWTRQDPDLAILLGDPEFERLYPSAG